MAFITAVAFKYLRAMRLRCAAHPVSECVVLLRACSIVFAWSLQQDLGLADVLHWPMPLQAKELSRSWSFCGVEEASNCHGLRRHMPSGTRDLKVLSCHLCNARCSDRVCSVAPPLDVFTPLLAGIARIRSTASVHIISSVASAAQYQLGMSYSVPVP